MKKLLSITLILSLFFMSCVEKSKQGAWTNNDMKNCEKDALNQMQKSTEISEIFKLVNSSEEDFISCWCKEQELLFENWKIAKDETEHLSVLTCLGKEVLDLLGIKKSIEE